MSPVLKLDENKPDPGGAETGFWKIFGNFAGIQFLSETVAISLNPISDETDWS